MAETKRTTIDLTTHELELFAYHVSSLFRDSGSFGLSCKDGILANVVIEPSTIANNGYQPDRTPDVWDRCTINGRSVGNRCGAAKAYARMVAGDLDWHRAE